MKRNLRLGLPVLAVGAALIVAGVLLATTPWSTEEAAGGTIQYRLCDTVVTGPPKVKPPAKPQKDYVLVSRWLEQTETGDFRPRLEIQLRIPSAGKPSSVSIDPISAGVLEERYSSPAHEALLAPVVNTVRTEPLDPATAPWPYTHSTQMTLQPVRSGAFEFRDVDPGSGIVSSIVMGTGHLMHVHVLKFASCRSTMEISADFRSSTQPDEVTVTKDVHPDDKAAFQRLLDTVVVKGLDQ
jgi:hypothetical protein